MIRKSRAGYKVWSGVLVLAAGLSLARGLGKVKANTSDAAALDERIATFVRAKFGIPDTVKVTASPVQESSVPGFLTATITTDDGKQPKDTVVYLTNDHRYLIIGFVFAVTKDPKAELLLHIRDQFKVPISTVLTAGPPHDSGIPNFQAITVTAESSKGKQTQDFYLTSDNHAMVLGNIHNMGVDLKREALRTIVTTNQPSQGPPHAPVTIVEYADLECPMCAKLHAFLESDLLPKYPDKVRVIFKEFPLPMHDWSQQAAIANECVFQIKPDAFAAYRSLVFQNQQATSVTNVRDNLLSYADQVGVDRVRLAGCMDSQASLPKVEEGRREAKELDVVSTPTCFINGRMLVGFTAPDAYYKAVDAALKASK